MRGSGRTTGAISTAGFSLIEILVVLSLMALVTVFAMPSVTSYFKVSLSSAGREIASVVKEAYNSTVVTGRVHRVVYDLKEQTYWVESSPTLMLLDTKESLEKEERRKRFEKESDKKPDSPFQLERSVTRKKQSLPRGVSFEDVITQAPSTGGEPITEGLAYTHMFAHGLTEQTLIHLKDESKHKASLVIAPIVGTTDLYERYITKEEAFNAKQ